MNKMPHIILWVLGVLVLLLVVYLKMKIGFFGHKI